MSGAVAGVEIGLDVLRVVVRSGRRGARALTMPYTPDTMDESVARLAATAGPVGNIGVAIGMAHLHVTQVQLPPVPHAARRQMLTVEPERWFTMAPETPAAIALTANGELAFAAHGALVDAWVTALQAWGPVVRIDAAPLAVLRAVQGSSRQTLTTSIEAGAQESGIVEIVDGSLRSARRLASAATHAPTMTVAVTPPLAPDMDAAYNVALGASIAGDGALATMLLTPTLERQFVGAARRRMAGWLAAASLTAGALVWAAGASRASTLATLDADLVTARTGATEGSGLALRAMSIDREMAAINTTLAARADIQGALAALGARLPRSAVAQRVRIVGTDWQVEGNAANASQVLAALAAEPQFERVRFLAPSNRFRDGTEDRETFAVAFAVR